MLFFIEPVWFPPTMTLEGETSLSAVGTIAGGVEAIGLVVFICYGQRLGPYTVVDCDGVHLTHGLQVALKDVVSLELTPRRKPAGDVERLV